MNPAPSKGEIDKITHTYKDAPAMTINTNKIYCAGLNTNRGLIVVELDPKIAPKTVNNFVYLAQNHFYDGEVFHRVIQSGGSDQGPFIIQAGNPSGTGTGPDGPGYSFADEAVQGTYTAGTIAMANKGANTNGSQFFISTQDNSKGLDKKYNLFGKVVKGLDIAQSIQGPNENDNKTAPDLLNYVVVAES